MGRFQREAQVLASLNHTHIASIYGLEDSSGVSALVMELVEGPTLAERIHQGALPIDEALPIARQIAEALECAHEGGNHPPRPEACEHQADKRRKGEGPRLRPREGAAGRHIRNGYFQLADADNGIDEGGNQLPALPPTCLPNKPMENPPTAALISGRSARCCMKCWRASGLSR